MVSLHLDTARTWRGGQQQVLLTVLGLLRLGQRAVLAAHPEGELIRRARAAGVDDPFPVAPRTEMDLRAGWKLAGLLRETQPDVIHAHDAHAVAAAGLAMSIARGRASAVREREAATGSIRMRGLTALIASRRVDFPVRRNAFSRWKYQQVDRFICASRAIRTILVRGGVRSDRTVVVYEGVDVERIAAAPPLDIRRAFQLPAGCPVVGNVGALVPHKGQLDLVDAVAALVRDVPDVRVLIVGEGELRSELERRIRRHHLEAHVILTGFRDDIPSLLRGLDLFVMSSVTEGLGTSVLDAMSAGLPVVGTRAGGIPESIVDEETGLLVPVRDPAALAHAMTRILLDGGARRGFGEAGQRRARERFTAERMVNETAAVYAAAAGTSRSADSPRSRAVP